MKRRSQRGAFSLIELLVVIGIIALLATLGLGALHGFSGSNAVAAGNRQLLDDIGMARNHALAQRTTVYMVFVPPLAGFNLTLLNDNQKKQFTNRLNGQFTSYNFLTLRSPGDQPGHERPRYLSDWKSLPEGVYIRPERFAAVNTELNSSPWYSSNAFLRPFPRMFKIPFPTPLSSTKALTEGIPVLAFNYRGELIGPDPNTPRRGDQIVELTRGAVIHAKDPNGKPMLDVPELIETPKGNYTNNPYIRVDWLTGRARIEEPKAL